VAGGRRQTWTCKFLYGCTGYYDYAGGYQPDWPGLADYRGRVVHPQKWPEDLDLKGKRILVIGSGATAVTLVPALADAGADVTMLQRSPSWVMTVGRRDPLAGLAERLSPAAAYSLLRTRNALLTVGFFSMARRRPQLARRILRRAMAAIVGPEAVAEHFTPAYDPWTQRLCIAPEGDFLHALADGRARIVTDQIDRFVTDGVRLTSGPVLKADVVVSATGLVLQPWGGVALSVDGEDVDLGSCVVYRGCMLSGVPNLGFCVGYINASWTLRTELSHAFLCRVLAYLDDHGLASATPVPPAGMQTRPVLDLTSGYVLRGADRFPKQGDREPWLLPQNWFLDRRGMARARVEQDMVFTRRSAPSVDQARARQAS
jgi:cation diffusion facilitator CzcD-associated flavoprotein CzcO